MRVSGLGDDQNIEEIDGPLNVEIDHGNITLEVTITHDRVYFDRYGEEEDDHQFMYKFTRDILNKLKEEYG